MSVNSIASTQSQPLPDSNENPISEESTTTTTTHASGSGAGIKRNGRPTLKNSQSHPIRASSDSFYGPLSPSSMNNSLSDSITLGLPPPNSSRSSSNPISNKVSQRPKLTYWSRQLLIYLIALLLMKLLVLLIFWIFPFLFTIGKWLLGLFGKHKRAQVVFAMAIFPLIMNVLQFWLIDTLLRHNPNTSSYSKLISDDIDERDGLINNREGENGDDNQARESGEYDYEDDDEEESTGKKVRNSSRESSEDHKAGDENEEDDGWGWGETSRKSLEGLGNQARKGLNAIRERFNPNSSSTSNDQPQVGGSSNSKKSSRKGVPQSLRFSNHPTFANESQTHLVGEASDDDEEEEDDQSTPNQNLNLKSHAYPPSLEASPVSSPRSSASAKLGENSTSVDKKIS